MLMFAFWVLVAVGLTVTRIFIVGELDNSPSSLYKDAAHLLFGGAFVYACMKTFPHPFDALTEEGDKRPPVVVLWAALLASLVAEVVFALRDNF